jgi:hypothetical protein
METFSIKKVSAVSFVSIVSIEKTYYNDASLVLLLSKAFVSALLIAYIYCYENTVEYGILE